MADRPGDLGGGKNGCGDLVEQWLEQVMIAPVDKRDADTSALEVVYQLQAAEAPAHDNDVMISHKTTLFIVCTRIDQCHLMRRAFNHRFSIAHLRWRPCDQTARALQCRTGHQLA
jgi:hypothetical protein